MLNMINVVPEIMHLDNLNVAKQSWTKGAVQLMSEHMKSWASNTFKAMGTKLDVRTKSNGKAGTAWFKASVWAELVNGSDRVPAGLAPWMASFLFHIGADFLKKQAGFTASAAAGTSAEEIMRNAYGVKGQQILDTARLFDAYKEWHDTLHLETPDAAARERVALQAAIAGNKMVIAFKAVAKETGKTWVFHIALYIVPRSVHRWGNLWVFSSAKLESRGKVMKKTWRKQSSGRPREQCEKLIRKSRKLTERGGALSKRQAAPAGAAQDFYFIKGHANVQAKQVMARVVMRESRRLGRNVPGHMRRRCEQLCAIGKVERKPPVKCENNVPERWAERVPAGTPFTVEALMLAMLTGKIEPLYDTNGLCQAAPVLVDGAARL